MTNGGVWRLLRIAALATIACAWVASPATAKAAGADAEAGKQIFQEKCTACHTIGKGNLVGPDLKGVTALRPREWLQQWIAAPDRMLAAKDPVGIALLHEFHDVPMPNLGLSAAEANALIDYLATAVPGAAVPPAEAVSAPAPATSAPAASGDPEVGKELFTGAARFRNGGPPCMACHSVGGIGALGGGQLGPDLTTVVTRFGGAAATAAFVGGSPTPTMNAVWQRTPLTADERANVVAFLAQAAISERPTQAIWRLLGLAILGLAILLVAAGWIWRRRQPDGVRLPMLARQRNTARGQPATAPRRT
ncbi:MAG: cytochrome c [Burkholderiales bacterium]|nr:cytochrome c [Burkholderiales bacterium]